MLRITLICIVTAFIMSCSKKDSHNPGVISDCQVATLTDSATNLIRESYEFDDSHRVIKYQSYLSGKKDTYVTYTYGPGTVQIRRFYEDGVEFGFKKVLHVSSSGLVTRYVGSMYDSISVNHAEYLDTSLFIYSMNNNLVEYSYRSTARNRETNAFLRRDEITTIFSYVSGRLVKQTSSIYALNGLTTYKDTTATEYTYDELSPTVTVNPLVRFFTVVPISVNFMDQMPVKAVVMEDFSLGDTSAIITTYSYSAVLDGSGRVTKIRSVGTNPGTSVKKIETSLYTYNCP